MLQAIVMVGFSLIDLLYNIDNGWLNSLDNSLRKYGCQLSGLGDLPGSKLFNLFNTMSSEVCSICNNNNNNNKENQLPLSKMNVGVEVPKLLKKISNESTYIRITEYLLENRPLDSLWICHAFTC